MYTVSGAGRLPLAVLLAIGLAEGCTTPPRTHPAPDPTALVASPAPDGRPNLLLIVADDLGYADLGVFGSDIRTPNIDALAADGVLFTQFHTASTCAPTRAMLLSGNNNHVAGMGQQGVRRNFPGYENHLSERIAPLPRLLAAAGYHTYTVGKWHLGEEEAHSPKAAGFERSFNLLQGAGNHFNATGFNAIGGSTYREDGALAAWPAGRYSTDLYTEKLMSFIDAQAGDGRPFFAFAAYTSPHWPLQVPESELFAYRGHYDAGYDALREARFESLERAGIIADGWTLPPRNDAITPWGALTEDEQRTESRKMELYAAMVTNLDHHVGRLINHLKEKRLYDNTVVVFMSDNGAAGEDFYNRGPYVDAIRARYDNSYGNMGLPSSFVSYGPPWAEAGSAPFSRYKGYTREGGIVAPMIVRGPGVTGPRKSAAYTTVMDIAPTFLDIGKGTYPADGSVRPMLGTSLQPLLAGQQDAIHDDTYVTIFLLGQRAYVRQGRWKLSNLEGPFSEGAMELFDIAADPGESMPLNATKPAELGRMLGLWRERRTELGILLTDGS